MSSLTEDQKEIITSEYVKLNVGGTLFHTTTFTLTKFNDNMLAAMFSGHIENTKDEEGYVLIDRSGKHFGVILNFLRDGTVPLTNLRNELYEIRTEANFYCISELVKFCDQALVTPKDIIGPSTFTVLAKPVAEEVLKRLKKPVILLITHGNKCSVNNLQFFEKLALEFNGQIFFVRYVASKLYCLCEWSFYFGENKISTSVVYAHFDDPPIEGIYNRLAKLLVFLVQKPSI